MKGKAKIIWIGLFLVICFFEVKRIYRPWWEATMQHIIGWGNRLTAQGSVGGGWVCVNVDDASIYDAASKAAGSEKQIQRSYAVNLNVTSAPQHHIDSRISSSCFRKASLRELGYKPDPDVVYGVWRCEEDNVVGEFQLQILAKPNPMNKATDYCTYAMFYKDLDIPIGSVTDFYGVK